jgi:hypothetical protein
MSRLLKVSAAAVLVAPALVFASTAKADSPGQLTGGANVYQVKNVTKNGAYAASASAACNEEVRYSVRLHNAAYGGLTNVNVKADLASGKVTATNVNVTSDLAKGSVSAVPAEGASAGTTGSVTVTVASGNQVYENGSAKLYDANGTLIKDLPDTITTSGVNVGNIKGSTTEFVNFQAKVNCPTPTPTPTPAPTTPASTPTPAPAKAPTALPNTGAGDVLGAFAGVSAAGTAAHAVVRARRNRR